MQAVEQESYTPTRLDHVAGFLNADDAPAHVGPYRILATLGEGGMGVVYKAEQLEPIRRTVALKLIKPGLDSCQIIARFEGERQALAMMDHPNVARVFEAGTTDAGRLYFVMEYVPGRSITSFCDENRYTTRQRLGLFLQACEAIQHAHQKAIIHRDLKPSNILVASRDGKPMVKVIDFGVAKATGQSFTDHTLYTHAGQLVGTPEYMSPEQAELGTLEVDTRSDVYSLGVILYELLSGSLPFDAKTLRNANFAQAQQILRNVDPPRPSARLSSMGALGAQIAGNRQTRIDALTQQLRRELEWIPLKAMRKDRTQRYATANELAEDIRNYLTGRPLRAGPESAMYRARKFLRRNKRGVAASAAMALLLIGGIVATTYQAFRATRAERNASSRQREAEIANDNTQAVNDFLTNDLLGAAKPTVAHGRELSVRQALDDAAAKVGQRFHDKPEIEAAVRHSVALTYMALGLSAQGLPHARAAVEIDRRLWGDDHPQTLDAMSTLAKLLRDSGDASGAEALHRQVLEARRMVLGPDDPNTLFSMAHVVAALLAQERFAEAEPLCREALQRSRRSLPMADPETAGNIVNLSTILRAQGKLAEAEQLLREALASYERAMGKDHEYAMAARNNLAFVLQDQGRLDEAESLLREVVANRRRALGERHPNTLSALYALGCVMRDRGRPQDAQPLLREAWEGRHRELGANDPETLGALNMLASALRDQQKFDEAEPLTRQVYERRRVALGDEHADTLASMSNLANLLLVTNRYEEAEPLCAELYRRASAAPISPKLAAVCMSRWGPCLVKLGRYEEAEAPLREAHRRLVATSQPSQQTMRRLLVALAEVCDHANRPEEGAEWRRRLAELERAGR
jgi:non-specific serine/threonine protein kinase/serine/threonine-protein kinase